MLLVSPADALSLGAETLFVFVSLPEHSHSQSIKPVVHWISSVERLHGSKNRAQPLVFSGSRKSIKEEKNQIPKKILSNSQVTSMQPINNKAIYLQAWCRECRYLFSFCYAISKMIHGRFSLAPPNRGTGAISAGLFAGIAPVANVVCARPSTEVEGVFVHFPVSSNFCEKCSAIQTFALALCSPGRQEWVTSMVPGWKESSCQNFEGPRQNCKNCLHCFLLGHKLLVDHLSKATWW